MLEAAYWDSRLYHNYRTFGGLYSSYPTQKQFTQHISDFERFRAVHNRNAHNGDLALHVNFPQIPVQQQENNCLATDYIKALLQEVYSLARLAEHKNHIQQLHFTGNPTCFTSAQLQQVWQMLARYFVLEPHHLSTYSININPYQVNWAFMGAIRDMGFNRINLQAYVEDFNFQRLQTIYEAARTLQYYSISIAITYGTPRQTPQEFEQEIRQTIALMPERISLSKYQQSACYHVVPQLLELAVHQLREAGYQYAGRDCFVLPDDELISAHEAGLVSPCLQGFNISDFDILGFGVAAPSQIGLLHYQNTSQQETYQNYLKNKQLPPARGIHCSTDDLIRRDIIHTLTNHNQLHIAELEHKFNIVFTNYFRETLPRLHDMHNDSLIDFQPTHIKMTHNGHFFVDAVCQLFDRSVRSNRPTTKLYTRIG